MAYASHNARPVGKVAVANHPTGARERWVGDDYPAWLRTAQREAARRGWRRLGLLRLQVNCALCPATAAAYGQDSDQCAASLRQQGWHVAPGGRWRCCRCARRRIGDRRRFRP